MSTHHCHSHHHGQHSSIKMLSLAIALTLLFSVVEFVGGYTANSLALIGDAAHMAFDAFALLIALIASWIAAKPASIKHTFGLGRAEVLAGGASCLLMLVVTSGIAIEAIERLRYPPSVSGTTVMLIACIGIMINFLVAYLLSRGEQTLNIRAAVLHVIADLLGSFAALASGAVIYFTHWKPIDPILSLFIALLITYSSIRLLQETVRILMEAVPRHLDYESIQKSMCDIAHVAAVHNLHIWTVSSKKTVLSAHVQVESLHNSKAILYTLKSMLEDKYNIQHITVQLQEDSAYPHHSTASP